jgi:hypothetical protein
MAGGVLASFHGENVMDTVLSAINRKQGCDHRAIFHGAILSEMTFCHCHRYRS